MRPGATTSPAGSRSATSCSRTGTTTSASGAGTATRSATCCGRHEGEASTWTVRVERADFADLVSPDAELTLLADGLRLHRRAGLERRRAGALLQRHSRRPAVPVDRARWRRAGRLPDVQGQRHGVRRRGPADRVRARVELDHPLPRRRLPRDGVLPPRRRVPQQPQRSREPQARRLHLLHRSRLRALERLDRQQARRRCSASRPCSVFRTRAAQAELVTEPGEFEQPNGLCFSPDESLMYVNDSPRAHIKVFDVADDGKLRQRARAAPKGIGGTIEGGSPDGMECDEFGNVWTTGPGRRVGARPRLRRADRHDRDARGVRQPVLGRARSADAVPHDVDHGALDPDAVHLGAAPPLRHHGADRHDRQPTAS